MASQRSRSALTDPHTASVQRGVEFGTELAGADTVEDAFDERQVHAADQLGLLVGQHVERTVRERDRARFSRGSKPSWVSAFTTVSVILI